MSRDNSRDNSQGHSRSGNRHRGGTTGQDSQLPCRCAGRPEQSHGLGLADQRGAGVDGELHGLSGVVLIAVGLVVGCAATRGLEAGDVEDVFDGEPKPGERPSPGVG